MFDKEKLHTKLCILYYREEFRILFGAIQLLHFIISNNLKSSVLEIVYINNANNKKKIFGEQQTTFGQRDRK